VLRRALALAALAVVAAGAATLAGRLDRDRQYRQLLAAGEQALQAGDGYGAIERFSGALALRPTAMAAYYRRGEAYRRQRRDEEAIRDLREAIHLAPDAPQPLVALAELYDVRGDVAQAATWYAQAAVLLKDESPSLLYSLALARYRAGQPGAAVDPLRRALARDDSAAEAHYLLGLVYRDIGQTDAAVAALERAVRIDAELTPAREELAALYRALDRPADEMRQLQALADASELGRRIELALAEARGHQYDRALATLSEAAVAAPNDSRIALAVGRVQLARAERLRDRASNAAALHALEQALAGTARRSEGLALYGRALYLYGEYEDAERLLREAVSTSPVAPEAFRYLADASERLGHPLAARDALLSLDALEGDTVPAEARAARARRVGSLSLAGGDALMAAEYLAFAVGAGIADAPTLGLLAEARAGQGDADAARAALARALELAPDDPALARLARRLRTSADPADPAARLPRN
jgi:tetratricopeptide (TPR) repeat protein